MERKNLSDEGRGTDTPFGEWQKASPRTTSHHGDGQKGAIPTGSTERADAPGTGGRPFVNAGEKLRRDPSVGRKGRRPEDDGGRCGERGHHDPEVERIGVKGVSFASRGFRSWCPTP
jgi:hypothetical protein